MKDMIFDSTFWTSDYLQRRFPEYFKVLKKQSPYLGTDERDPYAWYVADRDTNESSTGLTPDQINEAFGSRASAYTKYQQSNIQEFYFSLLK